MLAVSSGIKAQEVSSKPDSTNNFNVEYIGTDGEMIAIAVHYLNLTDSKYNLSIYNSDGVVIFRNVYSAKSLNKTFKIPVEHGKLNVVVTADKVTKNFEVYNTSRVVEDVVVRKIH
jgi:hypothetical protein